MRLAIQILMLLIWEVGDCSCHESNGRYVFNRSSSSVTTFITTDSSVFHIEVDKYIEGNLLFSDGSSIKTVDGDITQAVVGQATVDGYTEGIGSAARFSLITGFSSQIDRSKVVVVDHGNHCLRIVDRPTSQTQTFAGTCTKSGYKEGSQALFNYPWNIIPDNLSNGMLFVLDRGNKVIRHVSLSTRRTTTFYTIPSTIFGLVLSQDVHTGDLYVTTESAIYIIRYYFKTLIWLAGDPYLTSFGDGGFPAARFNIPFQVLFLQDRGKLLVADNGNHRLRILDRSTNTTSSICTGDRGHADGDVDSCSLLYPRSLLVLGDSLYIGENQHIRILTDNIDRQASSTTVASITKTAASVSSTEPYPCSRGNITKQLEAGEKTTDVELEPGRTLRLPAGEYLFTVTSVIENCSVQVSVTGGMRAKPCLADNEHSLTSTKSGIGELEIVCSDVTHRLSLPIGEYKYEKIYNDYNCSTSVKVIDHLLIRHLNTKVDYSVPCRLLSDPVSKSAVESLAQSHSVQIYGPEICGQDCSGLKDTNVKLSCVNTTLTITWPTDQTYSGNVTDVPFDVLNRLGKRLSQSAGSILKIFVLNLNPPVVLPRKTDVVLSTSCLNNKLYNAESDLCI